VQDITTEITMTRAGEGEGEGEGAFYQEIGFKFEEEHTEVVHLLHMWCRKFGTS
jgi:hypothetical protein